MAFTENPELLSWMRAQQNAGLSAENIINTALTAGWSKSTLEKTIERILPFVKREDRYPKVPKGNHLLNLNGHWVSVLTHINTPQVVVLGGFLTHDECDALIEGATEHMQRSLVSDYDTGGDAYSEVRTSYGMFYKRGETELVQRVESRIAALCDWPVENGEGLQILNYKVGAEYKPHHDYFPPDATTVKLHGQRVATLVMYLNDPIKGGGTVFPDLNLEVLPKKGNAVFFSYPEANPSSKSLHGGSPVLEGEKWAATKWMRASAFV